MKIITTFIIGAAILAILALAILYFRFPFAFQELTSLSLLFNSPTISEPNPDIKTIDELDAFAAEQFAAKAIPGAAIAIVADGEIVWSNGYGMANKETNLPATADTPFMIGSISKAVTAVALMHAVENGALDLDADINEYLAYTVNNPQLATEQPITLRHLATHTSGITDRSWLYANSYTYGDPTITLEQFLYDYLATEGANYRADGNFLESAPGEAEDYSNIAASLIGQIIDEGTGSRLDEYSRDNIFNPLGMSNTGWFLADFADQSQIAQPYAFRNQPIDHYGYPTWPEGQLRTSVHDLAQLLAMVMNGGELDGVRVLDSETIETMLTKQSFPGLESTPGQGILWAYKSSGIVGHDGGDHGVASAMYFNPESNVGIVVLTNASPSRAIEPVFNIVRQVLTGETTPLILESIAVDS